MKQIEIAQLPEELTTWLTEGEEETYSKRWMLIYGLEVEYINTYYYDGKYYFLSILSEYEGETLDDIMKRLRARQFGKNDFILDCLRNEHMTVCDLKGHFVAVTVVRIEADSSVKEIKLG